MCLRVEFLFLCSLTGRLPIQTRKIYLQLHDMSPAQYKHTHNRSGARTHIQMISIGARCYVPRKSGSIASWNLITQECRPTHKLRLFFPLAGKLIRSNALVWGSLVGST